MEATSIPIAERARATPLARDDAIPFPIYAALFASAAVVIGVLWDISWHTTIGRDSFWTPAHMAIYAGGLVAGLSCGWLALRVTFAGSDDERAASVRFWRFFRAPLGAWVCIWGTFAMLASAPFDDWWHNAYGLDVKILSPPHTVLAVGILAIQVGAVLMTLARQNRAADVGGAAHESDGSRYAFLYAIAAGLIVLNGATMSSEYHHRILMHSPIFFQVACAVFPLYLLALARPSMLRWPATTIAGMYTAVTLALVWILPLFPAQPRLGPIYQNVTHMVPPDFPLLIVAPAIAIDLVLRRLGSRGTLESWRVTVRDGAILGAIFFVIFLGVQWPFASFLMSGHADNWLFAANNYYYGLPKESFTYRHLFLPADASAGTGFIAALGIAMLSATLGLRVGRWLSLVRR